MTKEQHKSAETKKETPKQGILQKLFFGLNLTWPKLIIFSVIIGLFVGILMTIPALKDTSFTRIGVIMHWWVLFGIIIFTNCKKPLEAALKCFVFFLISQPLIYLVQVPFAEMGWGLFGYYRYWFLWTLTTFPLAFIGNWAINRNGVLPALILSPAILLVALEGIGEFKHSPQYLLSGIFCVAIIIVIIMGALRNWKLRGITIILSAILMIPLYLIFGSKPSDYNFRFVYDLSQYGITTEQEWRAESDYGGKIETIIDYVYEEDGTQTDQTYYIIDISGNGEQWGKHDIKLISPTETKTCHFEVQRNTDSFSCD